MSQVPAAGLVLDGALTSVVERAQELFPYAPVRWIAASRYRSIERVGALTIPKLFLHARADEVVPFAHGRRLFEAAAPPKRFVPLQGGHGDAFEADSAAYFEAIGRFVAELDQVGSGTYGDSDLGVRADRAARGPAWGSVLGPAWPRLPGQRSSLRISHGRPARKPSRA